MTSLFKLISWRSLFSISLKQSSLPLKRRQENLVIGGNRSSRAKNASLHWVSSSNCEVNLFWCFLAAIVPFFNGLQMKYTTTNWTVDYVSQNGSLNRKCVYKNKNLLVLLGFGSDKRGNCGQPNYVTIQIQVLQQNN